MGSATLREIQLKQRWRRISASTQFGLNATPRRALAMGLVTKSQRLAFGLAGRMPAQAEQLTPHSIGSPPTPSTTCQSCTPEPGASSSQRPSGTHARVAPSELAGRNIVDRLNHSLSFP